jgi:hypothetical protein
MALLMIDSITEMGLIVDMVAWLHRTAGAGFYINYQGSEIFMNGKPLNILLDQGHTSNGAAGCAFVVIGLGGILALSLRHRQLKRSGSMHGFTAGLYNFWLYMTAISVIFTIAAFVYVFVVTYTHTGQEIDPALVLQLHATPASGNPYPRDSWTPQNWYPAMLKLDLASSSARSNIKLHLQLMQAWQWNLIPMVVLGIAVSVLAFMDRMRHARVVNRANGAFSLETARHKSGSPYS